MILVGQYFTKDVLKEWVLANGIQRAKQNISNFEKLNKLFNTFKNYEKKESENIIFILCSRYFDDYSKYKNIVMLKYIEKALQSINFESWNSEKKNYFITEFTSDNLESSNSPFNELLFYSILLDQFGINNVELYPDIGNNLSSDVKISYKNEQIYIEIGCLQKSLPSIKIEKILNKCAEYFGKKCSKGHIKFEVDSSKFPIDDEGNIDEIKSIKKICNELDRLNIYSLKPFNKYINIENLVSYLRNEELFKPLIGELHFFPTLNEILKIEFFKNWIENNKINIINGFDIITTVYLFELDHVYIEFHTEYYSPSKSANLIHYSFISHIKRHLKGQLYQIKKDHPNIIAIETGYLNMFIIGNEVLIDRSLIIEIKNYLKNKNVFDLSGILLYSNDTDKSMFIKNPTYKRKFITINEVLNKVGIKIIIK